MGHRIVDPSGYPIGDLYMIYKYTVEDEYVERDRRKEFEAMGVPKERMMHISPILMGQANYAYARSIPLDFDLDINLPPDLNKK